MNTLTNANSAALLTATTGTLNSLLVPLHGRQLLLPNVTVAEVVSYAELMPVTDQPAWLMGVLDWRGIKVPVVSYEVLSGDMAPRETARVAVMNGIAGKGISFYAIVVQGIPRQAKVKLSEIEDMDAPASQMGPLDYLQVRWHGELAVIPELDRLEEQLLSVI